MNIKPKHTMKTARVVLWILLVALAIFAAVYPRYTRSRLQHRADAKCERLLGPGWHAIGVDVITPDGTACGQGGRVAYVTTAPSSNLHN